jgi:hypothetical protein
MICDDCKGSGEGGASATTGKTMPCFRCDGTGELCDRCGESTAVCEGEACRDDEEDDRHRDGEGEG